MSYILLKAVLNPILLACHSPSLRCHLIPTTECSTTTEFSTTIQENVGEQVVISQLTSCVSELTTACAVVCMLVCPGKKTSTLLLRQIQYMIERVILSNTGKQLFYYKSDITI